MFLLLLTRWIVSMFDAHQQHENAEKKPVTRKFGWVEENLKWNLTTMGNVKCGKQRQQPKKKVSKTFHLLRFSITENLLPFHKFFHHFSIQPEDEPKTFRGLRRTEDKVCNSWKIFLLLLSKPIFPAMKDKIVEKDQNCLLKSINSSGPPSSVLSLSSHP